MQHSFIVNEVNVDVLDDDVPKYKYIVPRERNKSLFNIRKQYKACADRVSIHSNNDTRSDRLLEEEIIQVSSKQLLSLENIVFTPYNLEKFSALFSYQQQRNYYISQFIVNIIMDNELQGNVIKYNESRMIFQRLTCEELYAFLRKKFLSTTIDLRKKSNEDHVDINNNVTKRDGTLSFTKTNNELKTRQMSTIRDYISANNENRHPINTYMKFGYRFYDADKDQSDWITAILHDNKPMKIAVSNAYNKEKYKNELSHSLYSIIHPLYEEYEFVLFNGSHQLAYPLHHESKKVTTVHSNTKIRIRIPPPEDVDLQTFFIIFDSRLVHGGTHAHRESLCSSTHRINFRMFAYAMKSYNDTKALLQCNNEHSDDELKHGEEIGKGKDFVIDHTRKGEVDYTSFEICGRNQCNLCKKFPKAVSSPHETVIDIKNEYFYQKRSPMKYIDIYGLVRPESFVCGDLNVHGWEVHTGIPYAQDIDKYKFLRLHLEFLYNRNSTNVWKNIQASPGRQYMKLDQLRMPHTNKQVIASQQYLNDVCFSSLHQLVVNIHSFKNNKLQGNSVLANRGKCANQNLHRDYKRYGKIIVTDANEVSSSRKRLSSNHCDDNIRLSNRRKSTPKRFK